MAVATPEKERLRLDVEGMTCASCAARIERKLNKLDGVEATVNYATEAASVSFDPAAVSVDDLIATVEAIGYHAALPSDVAETPTRPARCGRASSSRGGPLLRRQIQEGQEIAGTHSGRPPPRIEPCARRRPARKPHPERCSAGSYPQNDAAPRRIRPSRIQATQGVVQTTGDADKFSRHRAVEVGPRNFAVRWNEPSLLRMIPSSTRAAQGRKSARRVLEWRYSARFIMPELRC